MTKPELPNSDSASNDPNEFNSELSEELSSPLFDIDSESEEVVTPNEAEGSSLELFPMPTSNGDGIFEESSELKDLDLSTSLSEETMPEAIESPSATEDVMEDSLVAESSGESLGSKTESPSAPPVEAAVLAEQVEELASEVKSEAAIETLEKPTSTEKAQKKKAKKDKKKKDRKPSPIGKFGKKVAQNPLVKTLTSFSGWPWVIALGASGATTITAFSWLAGLPPVPNCKNPAATWSQSGKLYCADQAARQKDPKALASALDMVGDWDPEDPLFDQVQKLSDDWSRSILGVAQKELDQGKLNEAIKLAEKVPKSSSYYDESRQTVKDWQKNWKEGEKILEKARDAIQEQDWAVATDQMRQLVQLGGEHWQRRADKVISEMTIEQDAFRQLNVANDRAGYGTVRDIESAILLATKIDAKRLARKKLVSYVDRWSEKLIELADYYYEIGDYETATEAAAAVPPGSKVGEKALGFLQASRAQTASEEDSTFGYLQAIAYGSQVPKTASIAAENKESLDEWETQVQSIAQMEFAKIFTRFDQEAGYKIAIDHAALIDTENPKRVEAQTLIAQWDKQQKSVVDRQAIARASKLAEKTDVASVQAAIAEARRVKVDSPLRLRAQTLIAEWEGSIEKREDQPILDKAIALADQGDLYAAIKQANKIGSDRALYDDAQDAAYKWNRKIQIAEDDPILDEAYAMAQRGELSNAIAKASEVGYGRALYYEAQDLIGQWIAERNAIEAARRPPEPEPDYYEEEQYYEPEDQYYEPQSNNYVNNTPTATQPYQEEYVDSATGAGISGGPEGF